MIYILFNPKANNSRGESDAKKWGECLKVPAKFICVIGLDLKKFFNGLKENDSVVLSGGDGTINRFANDTYGMKFKNKVYYVKCGSGNDFYRDMLAKADKDGLIEITPYLKKLPLITVNGIKRRFINGIGYGLDGECCHVGDEIRKKDPNAVINYKKIAVKLLLGKFRLRRAEVEVDGKTHHYKNVWLSSTMYGHYYGGGMMAAPDKDREKNNDVCDVVTLSSRGRLHTLLRFPTFSSGKHKNKKWLSHIVGKKIKVSFDIPCALQIDGDVIENVSSYTVSFE